MNISEQNLFIGGHWTPSESGGAYESLDPFTGKQQRGRLLRR